MSQHDDFDQNPRPESVKPYDASPSFAEASSAMHSPNAPVMADEETLLLYQRISHRLKAELGEAVWRAWIKPLRCVSVSNGCLVLAAQTDFLKDRIITNYADRIRYIASYEHKAIHALQVMLES